MLIFLMAALFNNFAEARVYCQDSNATPFLYLGFSCPVLCNNVVEAVKRLQRLDDISSKEEMNSDKNLLSDTETDVKTFYIVCDKIFNDKMATDDVQRDLNDIHNNSNCRLTSRNSVDVNMRRCFRRSYQKQFLEVFTNILNKHAHGAFKFTEEITSLILERVLGRDFLRQNTMNVKKLVLFLKKALTKHKRIAHTDSITLASKHCSMISVPGCFCKTGYVEDSGQCVKPSDCLRSDEELKYISRVNIK